jgi:hypothetical protein
MNEDAIVKKSQERRGRNNRPLTFDTTLIA